MSKCAKCGCVGTIVDLGKCCRVRAMMELDGERFNVLDSAALSVQVEHVKRAFLSEQRRK